MGDDEGAGVAVGTAKAWRRRGRGSGGWVRRVGGDGGWQAGLEEELEPAKRDSLRGMEEAVGADAVETAGRDMLEEAAQELVRREGHRLADAVAGVAVGEGHAAVVGGDEALVGKRGAMDVAAEVFEEGMGVQVG